MAKHRESIIQTSVKKWSKIPGAGQLTPDERSVILNIYKDYQPINAISTALYGFGGTVSNVLNNFEKLRTSETCRRPRSVGLATFCRMIRHYRRVHTKCENPSLITGQAALRTPLHRF